jgi:L-iditol 2-dehydrogenase
MFAPPSPGAEVVVPFADLWKDEVTITTTYAGSPKDIEQAMELIRSRRVHITDMISHRFGLADAGKGFQLVAKAEDSIKVVIEPQT